jgi:uncharacterized protein YerC
MAAIVTLGKGGGQSYEYLRDTLTYKECKSCTTRTELHESYEYLRDTLTYKECKSCTTRTELHA